MSPARHNTVAWIVPVIAAAITLALLNGVEKFVGFGPASLVGVAILIVVVFVFWRGRR
jgi:hypothetical protein